MKRNTLSNLLLALGLVLALGSGIVMARRTLAQGPGSQGPLGVSDTLGTAFTYQGRLTDTGGVPLSGDYDFQFQLYDALSGDTPVGSAVAVDNKEVTDGYFTAELDFGNVFDGTALWLEVRVRPGAETGDYTTLSPRQALTAAPYARYAAVAPWNGLNGVPAGFADDTDNTDDTVTWSEISGIVGTGANQVAAGAHNYDDRYYTETELQTDDSASVHWGNLTNVPAGFADDTDNTDDTVAWAEISGIVGSGASQVAAGAHNHDGVYAPTVHDHWGETWSGTGTGLTLSGGSVGLYVAGGSMGLAAEGSDYAVRGRSDSGYGVYGRSDNGYGVYAMGADGDLQLYGGTIYANRLSDSDLALHSNDYVDIHLDDDSDSTSLFRILNDADTAVFTVDETGAVSWPAQTGYVSVPAAAFRPQEDGYQFTNYGSQLTNDNGTSDYYYAPVQLPHGATVTKMTWYWSDTSTSGGTAALRRGANTGSYLLMAEAQTTGSGGNGSSYDDSISYATIDNQNYTYYLRWSLADTDVKGYRVVIEYTYTGPY